MKDEKANPSSAAVRLENKASGYKQTVKTDAHGRFALQHPYGQYHLEAGAPGMALQHLHLEIHSARPRTLDLVLAEGQMTVVVEDQATLVEDRAASHLHIDQSSIGKIPTTVQSRALESILLATPGFVADENGRFTSGQPRAGDLRGGRRYLGSGACHLLQQPGPQQCGQRKSSPAASRRSTAASRWRW